MLRVQCDGCGKAVRPGEDHHVVKIEVYAAEPAKLTEADLDADHMEAVADLIRESELAGDEMALEPTSRRMRFDLCPECRKRFLRDPLGVGPSPKFHFSEN